MIGTSSCRLRISWKSCTPSSPLVASRRKFMSCTTRSTGSCSRIASPSTGDAAPMTRAPCKRHQDIERRPHRLVVIDDQNDTIGEARSCGAGGGLDHGGNATERGAAVRSCESPPKADTPAARPCRLPGGELADHRQGDDPDRQEMQVQARELILVGEPTTHAERECAADDDAADENDRVLDQEVSDDVALAGADGAHGSDLLRASADVERGEAKDPEAGDAEDESRDHRQEDGHVAILRIEALPIESERLRQEQDPVGIRYRKMPLARSAAASRSCRAGFAPGSNRARSRPEFAGSAAHRRRARPRARRKG